MLNIRIEKTQHPKAKPDMNHPPHFGSVTTDHMFTMDYDRELGWHDPRIVPYGPFSVEPTCLAYHYAQEIFEGIKAFRKADGTPLLFRVEMNAGRFQRSARRVCIPEIPAEDFVQAVTELVRVERDWIPSEPETALYIRPVAFASEHSVGVKIADSYKFFIICCPVKNYHTGFNTDDSCWVETVYSRSAGGLTGADKCGCNYAGTLLPQVMAEERGYTEVLFADGAEHRYIGEISASNIFFVIDGTVVTPELDGSILPGITRDSLLHLCKAWGIPCEERKVSVDELIETLRDGRCTEAMSTGTAVVISPIGRFGFEGVGSLTVGDGQVGPISKRLYDALLAMQHGEIEAPAGWVVEVK